MPDQPADQPPKRMTTAEAAKTAQDAMALATSVGEDVERLAEKFTELDQRSRDAGAGVADPSAGLVDSEGKPVLTRDQVDSRIHDALGPLHDELHEIRQRTPLTEANPQLSNVLARLEDAERKVAGQDTNGLVTSVTQQLHPMLTDLRNRLGALEDMGQPTDYHPVIQRLDNELTDLTNAVQRMARESEGDPASVTLAEDHLSDQVEAQVDRKLAAMFEAVGLTPSRLAGLVREFDDLRQHVETHGTHVTRAITDQVANELERRAPHGALPVAGVIDTFRTSPGNGLGAAKKVLAVMRMVTSLGKEHQADLGQGGKFKFRSVDDAMDAVGHAMREVGLVLSPEILKDETTQNAITKGGTNQNGTKWENTVVWTTTKLTVRYTFVDPDDGSTHPIEMTGEGRDASDKSTSKAGSMAFKYALLQGLCIPVSGLDDSDASPPQVMEQARTSQRTTTQQPAAPAEQPKGEAAENARKALEALRNVYRVPGGSQAQYNRVVEIMNWLRGAALLDYVVEGATLDQHGHAVLATLQAPPPAEPPMNDEGAGEYH